MTGKNKRTVAEINQRLVAITRVFAADGDVCRAGGKTMLALHQTVLESLARRTGQGQRA